MPEPQDFEMISAAEFYGNYYGHPLDQLGELLDSLKSFNSSRGIIYLAGDSSLDNKFWFRHQQRAVNG